MAAVITLHYQFPVHANVLPLKRTRGSWVTPRGGRPTLRLPVIIQCRRAIYLCHSHDEIYYIRSRSWCCRACLMLTSIHQQWSITNRPRGWPTRFTSHVEDTKPLVLQRCTESPRDIKKFCRYLILDHELDEPLFRVVPIYIKRCLQVGDTARLGRYPTKGESEGIWRRPLPNHSLSSPCVMGTYVVDYCKRQFLQTSH